MRFSIFGLLVLALAACNHKDETLDTRSPSPSNEHLSVTADQEFDEGDDNVVIERAPDCLSLSGGASKKHTEIGIWVIDEGDDPATAYSQQNYYPLGFLPEDGEASTSGVIAYGDFAGEGGLRLSWLSKKVRKVTSVVKKGLNNIEHNVKQVVQHPGRVFKKVIVGITSCAKEQIVDNLFPSRDLVQSFLSKNFYDQLLKNEVKSFLNNTAANANLSYDGKAIKLDFAAGKDANPLSLDKSSLGKLALDLSKAKDWQSFAALKTLGVENGKLLGEIEAALKDKKCEGLATLLEQKDKSAAWTTALKNDQLKLGLACNLLNIDDTSKAGFNELVKAVKADFGKARDQLVKRFVRSQVYAVVSSFVPQTWMFGFANCLIDKFTLTAGSAKIANAGANFEAPLSTVLIPVETSVIALADGESAPHELILTEDGFANIESVDALFAEPLTIKEPAASGSSCK